MRFEVVMAIAICLYTAFISCRYSRIPLIWTLVVWISLAVGVNLSIIVRN